MRHFAIWRPSLFHVRTRIYSCAFCFTVAALREVKGTVSRDFLVLDFLNQIAPPRPMRGILWQFWFFPNDCRDTGQKSAQRCMIHRGTATPWCIIHRGMVTWRCILHHEVSCINTFLSLCSFYAHNQIKFTCPMSFVSYMLWFCSNWNYPFMYGVYANIGEVGGDGSQYYKHYQRNSVFRFITQMYLCVESLQMTQYKQTFYKHKVVSVVVLCILKISRYFPCIFVLLEKVCSKKLWQKIYTWTQHWCH